MREILFRGKRKDIGEWAHGSLISFASGEKAILPSNSKCFAPQGCTTFCTPECHDVSPLTVGQYTGLKDKNGQWIFEGDIVKYGDTISVVIFNFGCFCLKCKNQDYMGRNSPAIDIIFNEYPNGVEIIGNIHDKPEFLEV